MTRATEPGRVAVLLHLATLERWPALLAAIRTLPGPPDLRVNLVRDFDADDAVDRQAERIRADWPDARILVSDNRGMDVGGMLRLFDAVKDRDHDAILYAHGKGDDRWFQDMLSPLVAASPQIIAALTRDRDDERACGMVGAWAWPYDYFNPDACIAVAERLGITLRTSWEDYYRRYPAVRGIPLDQRIVHCRDHAGQALRPEIDLEYLRSMAGDWEAGEQPMKREWIRRFAADGVLGSLPYFPGNFFWIRPEIVTALAQRIDLAEEFERLPAGPVSDKDQQSIAHAWERMLAVFVSRLGYRLLSLADQGTAARSSSPQDSS